MRALALIVITAVGCSSDRGANGDAASAGVAATNADRAMNGKPALVESPALVTYADTGAVEDFGGQPHQHFSETSGGGIAFAENECPHWSLAQEGQGDLSQLVEACIAAFYAEGPGTDFSTHGHYINMMGNYRTVGIGIEIVGDGVTIVEDFGN